MDYSSPYTTKNYFWGILLMQNPVTPPSTRMLFRANMHVGSLTSRKRAENKEQVCCLTDVCVLLHVLKVYSGDVRIFV